MKQLIANILKDNKGIRKLYTVLGNMFFRLLSFFVKTDFKLILFNSFGGKKYDDSPKELYEYIIKDPRFKDYKFVWAFHEPGKFTIPAGSIIRTDSWNYFITALRAGIWITNSGVERGLSFKKKHTIYLNTWHGTPLKLMGQDVPGEKNGISYGYDIQCAQSEYEAQTFSRAFNIPYSHFVIAGLPRNDILIHRDPNTQKQMKKKLGIEEGKTVVLYAPTFREYEKDENLNCVIKPPISFSNWKKTLGEDYVVLLRLHYEVSKLFINDLEEGFVVDVSDYPSLNELMLASDVLVTDYSSIMFDYSILERPIFIFAYDFEKYKEKRGMYFDIRKELPGGMVSEQELLNMIRTSNYGDVINQVKKFRDRYVTFYGNATEATVDRLYAVIKTKGV